MFGSLGKLLGRRPASPSEEPAGDQSVWQSLSTPAKRALTEVYLSTAFEEGQPEPQHISELPAPVEILAAALIEQLVAAHEKGDENDVGVFRQGLISLANFSEVPIKDLPRLRRAHARLPELREALKSDPIPDDVRRDYELVVDEVQGYGRRTKAMMERLVRAETREQRMARPLDPHFGSYLAPEMIKAVALDCAAGALRKNDAPVWHFWTLAAAKEGEAESQANLGAWYWR